MTPSQALTYLFTSCGTFALNLLLVWALVHAGILAYLAAVAVGFAVETTALYIANRVWTFRGAARTGVRQGYVRAWIVALSTLCLVLVLEWLLVSAGFDYLTARIMLSPAAYAWSFLWDGSFTFKAFRFLH